MGIGWHEAKALVGVYKTNGPLGRTATLGRQCLYLSLPGLRRIFREAEAIPRGSLDEFLTGSPAFADELFKLLGADEVVSFDYSDFEGATVCHDMNLPIPEVYQNAFDAVFDSGTLEHIFNFPQAIKNCMLMLRQSGLFIAATPANNFMGHGFYQFSPELFFRLFSMANGFRVERMIAFDWRECGSWYEIEDPERLGKRVELWGTGQRIILWVVARRIRVTNACLTSFPQQSDYSNAWTTHTLAFANTSRPEVASSTFRSSAVTFLERISPRVVDSIQRLRAYRRFKREISERNLRFNNEAFKKVNS